MDTSRFFGTSTSKKPPFAIAHQAFERLIQDRQLMCRILYAYKGRSGNDHNCLGCTLNDQTQLVCNYLKSASRDADLFSYEDSFTILSFLLNSLWERISDVFDILSVPEGYRCRHYQMFIRIRRWANFFKHPKEFGWLVHHPSYLIDDTKEAMAARSDKALLIVDDNFLKKYYSADRSKGLAGEFKGREQSVVVLLPNVVAVVRSIANELTNFVNVVTKNPVYFEILNDHSTVTNYYESESVVSSTTTTTVYKAPSQKVRGTEDLNCDSDVSGQRGEQ